MWMGAGEWILALGVTRTLTLEAGDRAIRGESGLGTLPHYS